MVAVSSFIQRALVGAERTNAAIRLFPFTHKRKGHYGTTSIGGMKRTAIVHQRRTDQDMVYRFPYSTVTVGTFHLTLPGKGKFWLMEIWNKRFKEHFVFTSGIEITHNHNTGIAHHGTDGVGNG